jgi:hypothetical protein
MKGGGAAGVPTLDAAGVEVAQSVLATVGSEPGVATVCPPVVEYGQEFQTRAAEELVLLPEGSAVAEIIRDYAVMREETRLCVDAG